MRKQWRKARREGRDRAGTQSASGGKGVDNAGTLSAISTSSATDAGDACPVFRWGHASRKHRKSHTKGNGPFRRLAIVCDRGRIAEVFGIDLGRGDYHAIDTKNKTLIRRCYASRNDARKSNKQDASAEDKSATRQIENSTKIRRVPEWTLIVAVFKDNGISGTEFAKRADLVRLLETPRNKSRNRSTPS